MACLIIVLMLLGWAFAILGLGVFIHGLICGPQSAGEHRYKQEIEFTICGFLGLVGYSLLAACLNFAVPIDSYVSFCLMFVGWGLLIAKGRAACACVTKSHIAVAAMVFGYICVIPLTPVINYDTGLYHWQTIKWFIQEPLVPGLANLHDRFGFNSMWLTFAALVDLPPKLFASPNFISNSLAMFFYGVGIFLSMKSCFKGDVDLSNLFMASTAIPWLSKVAYFMNSPSPDLPVMLITFLIIYLLILSLERPVSRSVCLSLATILSAFAVSVKLVAAPLLLIVGGWCVVDFCRARLTRQGDAPAAKRSNASATRNPILIALCHGFICCYCMACQGRVFIGMSRVSVNPWLPAGSKMGCVNGIYEGTRRSDSRLGTIARPSI